MLREGVRIAKENDDGNRMGLLVRIFLISSLVSLKLSLLVLTHYRLQERRVQSSVPSMACSTGSRNYREHASSMLSHRTSPNHPAMDALVDAFLARALHHKCNKRWPAVEPEVQLDLGVVFYLNDLSR